MGPPFSPQDAIDTFELEEGFQIELIASEPLIADPVAMSVDENGVLYVVEMPGYPLDVGGSGRVRILTDTDGDGRPDESHIFADSLTLPTGIMRWKNGVIVTDAPGVIYLEDTDGDGYADKRETLLTGFALSNPQHNVNTPIYGLDNWIYISNEGTIWWTEDYQEQFGDKGAKIRFPNNDEAPTLGINGLDRSIRFRPDTYQLESLSSWSQFGHTFDAWGHYFQVNNANHQFHEVLASRYLLRNPDLPIRRAMHEPAKADHTEEVFPITQNPEHQLLTDRGVFTSACGITYYLGGLFPEDYAQATFVAEPVHNLVHVDVLRDDGATFTARRMHEEREFLASTDSWFRPVNFYIGPDGALYVVDYYRQIVEHPEWTDAETAAGNDLYNGSDRGRIYRITPKGSPPMNWANSLDLATRSGVELVATLENENIWWRRNAQRMLADHKPSTAIEPLIKLFQESTSPVARVHALWTLERLGRITPELISEALKDDAPGVRENALILAESMAENAPELVGPILSLERDDHPKVRFQLLNTLGFVDHPSAEAVRQRLLHADIDDEWIQIAALLSVPDETRLLFDQVVSRYADEQSTGRAAYFKSIANIVGARNQNDDVQRLLQQVLRADNPDDNWWKIASLEGVTEGLRRRKGNLPPLDDERAALLNAFFSESSAELRAAYLQLLGQIRLPNARDARLEALQRASELALDASLDSHLRADAVHLLGIADPTPYSEALKSVLRPDEDAVVQQASVRTLGRIPGIEISSFLLDQWATLTPSVRNEAIDVLMRGSDRIDLLIEALEEQVVQPSAIGWNRTVVLMRDLNVEQKTRARAVLSERATVRQEIVSNYAAALDRTGDREQGESVYDRVCSMCHQIDGEAGTPFGPDLSTVRHWSRAALMTAILDPARTLVDGYEMWFLELSNGESVSGVIADETPTSLVIRNVGGVETIVSRSDITTMSASSVSAMPVGLESQISETEMADLLSFLGRQ